jgi:type II secretory pathway component GspD/PulD (secretin)
MKGHGLAPWGRGVVRPPPWIIFSLLLNLSLALPVSAQSASTVTWEGEALSVTADKAPLAQVLQEVADHTGIEVQGLEGLQDKVSVHFAGLPLRQGLQELLATVNYLYLDGTAPQGEKRSTLVVVFGKREFFSPSALMSEAGASPNGGSVEERLNALQAAALEGNAEALRQALADPNPTVQTTALDLLAEHDRQGTVPLLVAATKSKQAEVRLRALDLLNNSPADERTVTAALGEAISGEDTTLKSYAIRALAERGGAEATGYLRQALQDPDPSIRLGAIDNIVRSVPPDQRLPLLQEAAQDQDISVRSAASTWLEEGIPER